MSITVDRIMELAEKHGVTLEFINNLIGAYKGKTLGWKTGRTTPTFSEITTLANYFNVPLDYLLGRSSHMEPPPPESRPPILPETPNIRVEKGTESFLYTVDSRGSIRKIMIPPDKVDRVLKLMEAAFPELM